MNASDAFGAADWVWTDLAERGADQAGESGQPSPALDAARAEGYAEGVRDGLEQGRIEALAELDGAMRALARAVDELDAQREQWAEVREADVAAIGTALARILLEDELSERPEAFAIRVRAALASFPPEEALRIRVHPRDLSAISQVRPDEGDFPITGSRTVQWIADDEVGQGGVIVEGPSRIVDGRVEPALARIYRTLMNHG